MLFGSGDAGVDQLTGHYGVVLIGQHHRHAAEFRPLAFMDGHGVDRLMLSQAAGQVVAQGTVRQLKGDFQALAVRIGQGDAYVAVVESLASHPCLDLCLLIQKKTALIPDSNKSSAVIV